MDLLFKKQEANIKLSTIVINRYETDVTKNSRKKLPNMPVYIVLTMVN